MGLWLGDWVGERLRGGLGREREREEVEVEVAGEEEVERCEVCISC